MTVRVGLEVLLEDRRSLIAGRRIGLLANATAVDRRLRHAPDLLIGSSARLEALFGPEHGLAGTAQDMVGVAGEQGAAGLVVHSLYGAAREDLAPHPEWLGGLDAVIIDLQDVGSRYYTYVWTACLMMQRCAELGVQVIVLDRPNPLGGLTIEGPSIDDGFCSFVGLHPIPVRHGLTIGELAGLFAREKRLDLELEVVPMQGWDRAMFFDATRRPWVMPSPNMPTLDSALVYPGGCLLEGTNLSEGRGTTRPFELVGAPWLDGRRLARALEAERLPGLAWRPLSFRPTFHKHAGEDCGGIQLHVTDRSVFRPLASGVALIAAAARLARAEFRWRDEVYEFVSDRPAIALLAGGRWLREGVDAGIPLAALLSSFDAAEQAFAERRQPYLLYREGA